VAAAFAALDASALATFSDLAAVAEDNIRGTIFAACLAATSESTAGFLQGLEWYAPRPGPAFV